MKEGYSDRQKPEKDSMRKYLVKSPLWHRGIYYPPGSSVVLSEFHAKFHGDRVKVDEPIVLPFNTRSTPPPEDVQDEQTEEG